MKIALVVGKGVLKVIEQNVLASIMIDNRKMNEVIDMIDIQDFKDFKNKEIYTSMIKLHHNHIAIDYMTLLQDLDKRKTGITLEYLMELENLLPTAENIDSYVKILKDTVNKKTIFDKLKELYEQKHLSTNEITEQIKYVLDGLPLVDNTETHNLTFELESHLNDILDCRGIKSVLKTKFSGLDELLAIDNGNLIVIGARPSVGKSAFALNLLLNFVRDGKRGLFVSLEMTRKEIANRMLSLVSGVDSRKITRRVGLNDNEKRMVESAFKTLQSYEIDIFDRGNLKVESLLRKATKQKRANKLDFIIVDYLGLLDTNEYRGQRTQQIGYISRKLKEIAMDLKIPVIALSQLNRNLVSKESGKARKPNLTDIRDSGSVEQDANAIMFLYKLPEYEDGEEIETDKVFLNIAKNRNGQTGTIRYTFESNVMRFIEH